MVYRIYVCKKPEFSLEADALSSEIKNLLNIDGVKSLKVINRYDVENIEKELFEKCINSVFSEPQIDDAYKTLPEADYVFAVEPLPGQFDQRADSAAQCIQLFSAGNRPSVKTAKVYAICGNLTDEQLTAIKKYVINPVECREADLAEKQTLEMSYTVPEKVEVLNGFNKYNESQLATFLKEKGLAMDLDDLKFLQSYFVKEDRDPTITEIKMIDTYWSDHCRHTTFLTTVNSVEFEDKLAQEIYEDYVATRKAIGRTKPINLMDLATIATRYHKKTGALPKIDESEEINACTVKIKVNVGGEEQDWLLLFKNETHNHPTEIEPFGGAATCIGGAIRDPLSGRSYVYAAMRVTGAGNPLKPLNETIPGKLPQRKIVTTAASGYSSYGNQIGLATGMVDEIYHDGYVAKRMEIGAVIAAAPAENVRREVPEKGDVVILLGGRTGRDGCGGATGSSKSHNLESLTSCGAEVQKGNAPEERKLQRLFRNPEASTLIKRCNDFGAGGVSVAIGELADGLDIDLDKVPKKYDGLDGTELAISESQERMAVVVEAKDVDKFIELATSENLEATVVATVTDNARLRMTWKGATIVDISREFLNSNGAEKKTDVKVVRQEMDKKQIPNDFVSGLNALATDLNVCSKRGLSERFDSTIGAGTVLMPFGGKNQRTPIQAMVNKVSVENADTDTCSFMSWGYNPFVSEKSPLFGGYYAVIESVCKLIATGATFDDTYLTFQEYFEKPNKDATRWGKPMSALLGAYKAQRQLKLSAIGGKDSMSGSFENIDVPPTLVSFAVTTDTLDKVVTPEFKGANNKVVLLSAKKTADGLVDTDDLIENFRLIEKLNSEGKINACYTVTYGGVAEAVMKMAFGNDIGFKFGSVSLEDIFGYNYGSFVIELNGDVKLDKAVEIGYTTDKAQIEYKGDSVCLDSLLKDYEAKLEPVFKCNDVKMTKGEIPAVEFNATQWISSPTKFAKPRVLVPVFPGTNCEYDTKKAFMRAGADVDVFVIKNIVDVKESVDAFAKKVKESQIIFVPGGFSGGDEPDGSGKFITAFFRNKAIKENVTELLDIRKGLVGGICNGFQALIKLGLVPYGKITDEVTADMPTLTFNSIARHQSMLVKTRIASNKSPWLMQTEVGEVYTVPISHGEGRFIIEPTLLTSLIANGQVATQYVDEKGMPTYDIKFNPNDSVYAIEGITSPDGRVFGKMGHSERTGNGLYKNVVGEYDIKMFDSAVKYFK
ncbi:MAG: phosphoribosylformylglycinamidine synthase [Clostridiales bacterium]|nr:phosphoribosylformylglycinamidine synthase [Clostridiales bacterium]